MKRDGGWNFRATKRISIIPHVLRANVNIAAGLRAIGDGPGGEKLRDAVSWTWGWLGHASVNSRSGRATVNTPGPGSISRQVHPSQRQRRASRRDRGQAR